MRLWPVGLPAATADAAAGDGDPREARRRSKRGAFASSGSGRFPASMRFATDAKTGAARRASSSRTYTLFKKACKLWVSPFTCLEYTFQIW